MCAIFVHLNVVGATASQMLSNNDVTACLFQVSSKYENVSYSGYIDCNVHTIIIMLASNLFASLLAILLHDLFLLRFMCAHSWALQLVYKRNSFGYLLCRFRYDGRKPVLSAIDCIAVAVPR